MIEEPECGLIYMQYNFYYILYNKNYYIVNMSTAPYVLHKPKKSVLNNLYEKLLKSNTSTVKPITKQNLIKPHYARDYYEKYGIIYTGNDLKSSLQSIL